MPSILPTEGRGVETLRDDSPEELLRLLTQLALDGALVSSRLPSSAPLLPAMELPVEVFARLEELGFPALHSFTSHSGAAVQAAQPPLGSKFRTEGVDAHSLRVSRCHER